MGGAKSASHAGLYGVDLEPDPRYQRCCSNVFRPGRVLRDCCLGLLVLFVIAAVIGAMFLLVFFVLKDLTPRADDVPAAPSNASRGQLDGPELSLKTRGRAGRREDEINLNDIFSDSASDWNTASGSDTSGGEPASEPESEPEPESPGTPEPEPTAEPEPELEEDSAPEWEKELQLYTTQSPEIATTHKSIVAETSEPESTSQAEPESAPTAEPEPEPSTTEEPETESEPSSTAETETELDPSATGEPDTVPATWTEPGPGLSSTASSDSESVTGAQPQPSTTVEPEQESEQGSTAAEKPEQLVTIPAEPEQEPSTTAESEREPSTTAEPEQEPSTTAEPEQEPSTTAEPEQEPSTTAEPEREPSTTAESERETSTTAEPEQEPSTTAEPEPTTTDDVVRELYDLFEAVEAKLATTAESPVAAEPEASATLDSELATTVASRPPTTREPTTTMQSVVLPSTVAAEVPSINETGPTLDTEPQDADTAAESTSQPNESGAPVSSESGDQTPSVPPSQEQVLNATSDDVSESPSTVTLNFPQPSLVMAAEETTTAPAPVTAAAPTTTDASATDLQGATVSKTTQIPLVIDGGESATPTTVSLPNLPGGLSVVAGPDLATEAPSTGSSGDTFNIVVSDSAAGGATIGGDEIVTSAALPDWATTSAPAFSEGVTERADTTEQSDTAPTGTTLSSLLSGGALAALARDDVIDLMEKHSEPEGRSLSFDHPSQQLGDVPQKATTGNATDTEGTPVTETSAAATVVPTEPALSTDSPAPAEGADLSPTEEATGSATEEIISTTVGPAPATEEAVPTAAEPSLATEEAAQCPLGELRCLDGLCISLEQVCDGLAQCPDGADELNCRE